MTEAWVTQPLPEDDIETVTAAMKLNLLALKMTPEERIYCPESVFARRPLTRLAMHEYDLDYKLPEFIKELEDIARTIPQESLAGATVELDDSYHDNPSSFKISYEDYETDEEILARVESLIEYGRRQTKEDFERYERLKRKFEG